MPMARSSDASGLRWASIERPSCPGCRAVWQLGAGLVGEYAEVFLRLHWYAASTGGEDEVVNR